MSDPRQKQVLEAIGNIAQLLPEQKRHLVEGAKRSFIKAVSITEPIAIEPNYFCIPPLDPDTTIWARENWTPNANDVVVASFPKTGTTWTREIVRQLLYKDKPNKYAASKSMEMPFLGYIEGGSKEKFEVVSLLGLGRTLWGTHLDPELLNAAKILKSGAKVVYVMRNPKDTIISLKKFLANMPWMSQPNLKKLFPDDLDSYIKALISGQMPVYGKKGEWYIHHIRDWMAFRDHPNFLPVFYEDLKEDPHKEIAKIAKHIGVELSADELDTVVKKTSFDTMKSGESLHKNMNLFRKGGVGGWKSHFTVSQSELVDEAVAEIAKDINIKFVYSLPRRTEF